MLDDGLVAPRADDSYLFHTFRVRRSDAMGRRGCRLFAATSLIALFLGAIGEARASAAATGARLEPVPRVEFGDVVVGTMSPARPVTFRSIGDQAVTLARIDGSGAGYFRITGRDCRAGLTLQPGESCTLLVRFRPGPHHITAGGSILLDAGSASMRFTLAGRGVSPGSGCTHDAALPARRDPRNPLAVATHDRASSDPLTGVPFFVDRQAGIATPAIRLLRRQGRYHDAALLEKIASQPETKRVSRFSHEGAYRAVRQVLCRIPYQQPGAVPLVSLYRPRA